MTRLVNLFEVDEVVDLEVDEVSLLGFGAEAGRTKNECQSPSLELSSLPPFELKLETHLT